MKKNVTLFLTGIQKLKSIARFLRPNSKYLVFRHHSGLIDQKTGVASYSIHGKEYPINCYRPNYSEILNALLWKLVSLESNS